MTKQLEDRLFDEFPDLFRYRHDSKYAIGYGITCGDGWFPLIRVLCQQAMQPAVQLEARIRIHEMAVKNSEARDRYPEHFTPEQLKALRAERVALPLMAFAQIKEKFGTLRIHLADGSDADYALVGMAEALSATLCETCGAARDVCLYTDGWWKTLCPGCAAATGREVGLEDE